jgi:hypothetical protein
VTALGDRLARNYRERAAQIGARAAVNLETALRAAWSPHNKSRETLNAISVRLDVVTASSLSYRVSADTPQASWVNDGTRAHPIAPKQRQWHVGGPKSPPARRQQGESGPVNLTFFWDRVGSVVTFRWVEHPGYRGDPWFTSTVARWSDFLVDARDSL